MTHQTAFETWMAEMERQFGTALAALAATRGQRNRLSMANMRPWLELAWEAGINTELRAQYAESFIINTIVDTNLSLQE